MTIMLPIGRTLHVLTVRPIKPRYDQLSTKIWSHPYCIGTTKWLPKRGQESVVKKQDRSSDKFKTYARHLQATGGL